MNQTLRSCLTKVTRFLAVVVVAGALGTLLAPVALAQNVNLETQLSPSNPIVWKTNYAKLASSNFYIRIGSKYFYGLEPVALNSDPGTSLTTLEATWKEQGLAMRFNLYFRLTADKKWELYDVRTSDGSAQGNWIYFEPVEADGSVISGMAGQANYLEQRRFLPTSAIDAEIVCQQCSLTAFQLQPLAYSAQGYALEVMNGLPAGQTITMSTSPNTGYGVNALLRGQGGEVVTNQQGISYEWFSRNEQIVQVESGNIQYAEGGCAYNIQAPCPNMNGQLRGVNPGVTQVQIVVRKDGGVVAQGEFDVKVTRPGVQLSTPTPTPSPVLVISPRPTLMPTPDNEQLKKELEVLKGTVGAIEVKVAQQQEEISTLQRVLQSIREFISNLF